MRVLYLTERFWPYIGGIEVVSAALLSGLRARGHEVTVVTDDAAGKLPSRDQYRGVPIHRFDIVRASRRARIEHLAGIRDAIAELRREIRPDIVNAVFLGATTCFAAATEEAHRAPMLLSFHGPWSRPELTGAAALARVVDRASWIATCSRSTLVGLVNEWQVDATRASVIPNAIDPPAGVPTPPAFDPPILLCAARLGEEKGIDVALAALARVLELLPDARLLIAGDGLERTALERQAAALGVSSAAEFLGWVAPPEMPRLLGGASVAVVPSRREGFGLFALEASLARRPLVASSVDGLAEILRHRKTALLVPPDDPRALADAVVELVRNPRWAEGLADSARRAALKGWTVKRHVEAHEELYERLAAEHANRDGRRLVKYRLSGAS